MKNKCEKLNIIIYNVGSKNTLLLKLYSLYNLLYSLFIYTKTL